MQETERLSVHDENRGMISQWSCENGLQWPLQTKHIVALSFMLGYEIDDALIRRWIDREKIEPPDKTDTGRLAWDEDAVLQLLTFAESERRWLVGGPNEPGQRHEHKKTPDELRRDQEKRMIDAAQYHAWNQKGVVDLILEMAQCDDQRRRAMLAVAVIGRL